MSIATPPEVIRRLTHRWFEEVWNQRREATIEELAAPDVMVHGLAEGEPLRGPAGFRRFYDPFLVAFPDMHVTLEDVLVDGDRSAVRLTGRATHAGPLTGIPATGEAVAVTAMVFMRWEDGKIVEAWNEVDNAGLTRQVAGRGSADRFASAAEAEELVGQLQQGGGSGGGGSGGRPREDEQGIFDSFEALVRYTQGRG